VWKSIDAAQLAPTCSTDRFRWARWCIDVRSRTDIVTSEPARVEIRSNSVDRSQYKSTDSAAYDLGSATIGQMPRSASPDHSNTVLMRRRLGIRRRNTERGVFKTTDGGAPEEVLTCRIQSERPIWSFIPVVKRRIRIDVAGERRRWTIISGAHEGGIYKSTDGGETWAKLAADSRRELFAAAMFHCRHDAEPDLCVDRGSQGRRALSSAGPAPRGHS